MANPQQPEVRRSARNPALSPDAMEAELEARRHDADNPTRLSTPDSRSSDGSTNPGEAAAPEQDKPDLDEFARVFGTKDDAQ